MKLAKLTDHNTLMLNMQWLPMHTINVRESFAKIRRGDVYSLDSNFNIIRSVEDWFNPDKTSYYDDQPYIRSAKNIWPIPTIIIINNKFMKYQTLSKDVTFEDMYKHFKGVCQICGERFSRKHMSIEHVFARVNGGTNHDFNKTLTCKPCNNQKGSDEGWIDKDGNLLKGITARDYFKMKFHIDNPRPEWDQFFIVTSKSEVV